MQMCFANKQCEMSNSITQKGAVGDILFEKELKIPAQLPNFIIIHCLILFCESILFDRYFWIDVCCKYQ